MIVAAGQLGELGVERGDVGGVGGDGVVNGDGRPIAGLEVVTEVLGPGEQIDADGLPPCGDVADPIPEQRPAVILLSGRE